MAFGRALRGPVDGDGELERETVVGECDSMRLVTKIKSRRHLRMRRGTAELLGASSTTFEHRRGWIRGRLCVRELGSSKGGGRGSAASLIGQTGMVEMGSSITHPPSPWIGPAILARHRRW